MYIIYILILFQIMLIFFYIYNKYYVKFIIVSNNNDILKIHTKPISLTKAIEMKNKLETEYYNQSLNGYPIKREVLILKFVKY